MVKIKEATDTPAEADAEVVVEVAPDDWRDEWVAEWDEQEGNVVEDGDLSEDIMHDLEHEEMVFAAQALDKGIEALLHLFMAIDPVLTQVATISKATNEDVTKAFALLGQAAQIRNIRMKGEGENGGS